MKINKAIRKRILRFVAKHFGFDIIQEWVYFGYNYGSSEEIVDKCWGDHNERYSMADHMYHKFGEIYDMVGSDAVMNRFFCEISTSHREKLYNYFLNHYVKKF